MPYIAQTLRVGGTLCALEAGMTILATVLRYIECCGEEVMEVRRERGTAEAACPRSPRVTRIAGATRLRSSLLLTLLLLAFVHRMHGMARVRRQRLQSRSELLPSRSAGGRPMDRRDGSGAQHRAGSTTPAWWQTFNDPVLDSLVASAYQQNLSLRVAGLRILEARAQRAIAAGELFPQAQQAFGDYSRIGLSKNGPSGASPNRFFSEWTLGASLAWELDFWGRFRRAIEAADANLDASVENYDDVLVLLLSDVAQSYTNVRIAEQRLAYAKQNVEIQRGSLRLAEDRLRNGATTRLDVTQGLSEPRADRGQHSPSGVRTTASRQSTVHSHGHAAAEPG